MSIFILATRGRTQYETVTLYSGGTTEFELGPSDEIRIKIGYDGATPLLDLVSNTPSALGSTVSDTNPCELRLDRADLTAMKAGVYDIEANVVDATDQDDIKAADKGVFVLLESQGGDVGL